MQAEINVVLSTLVSLIIKYLPFTNVLLACNSFIRHQISNNLEILKIAKFFCLARELASKSGGTRVGYLC